MGQRLGGADLFHDQWANIVEKKSSFENGPAQTRNVMAQQIRGFNDLLCKASFPGIFRSTKLTGSAIPSQYENVWNTAIFYGPTLCGFVH
jgi:hypothetical protein